MKAPVARPVTSSAPAAPPARPPRAFAADRVTDLPEAVEVFEEPVRDLADAEAAPALGRSSLAARLVWWTGGLLVSLALGLAAEALIRGLFEANPWLGWVGVAILVVFVFAALALAVREWLAVRRLRVLDRLRTRAADVLVTDRRADGTAVLAELHALYQGRADLAAARRVLDRDQPQLFDGGEMIRLAERTLMAPLDARARALTAGAARRVALVTAVSPRALIDIAFVAWESFRLAGAVARLYGARPGFFGSLRLFGAVLSHLAVTGGLALTDGVVEQLVGQSLAAKLSHRLGEGLVNGLMTVRVGISAMRVVRPLPFAVSRQPQVKDFVGDLANLTKTPPSA